MSVTTDSSAPIPPWQVFVCWIRMIRWSSLLKDIPEDGWPDASKARTSTGGLVEVFVKFGIMNNPRPPLALVDAQLATGSSMPSNSATSTAGCRSYLEPNEVAAFLVLPPFAGSPDSKFCVDLGPAFSSVECATQWIDSDEGRRWAAQAETYSLLTLIDIKAS